MSAAEKRPTGRPVVGEKVETRLPDTVRELLEERAEKEGVSRAEMIRRLVTDGLQLTHITITYKNGDVGRLSSTDVEEIDRQEKRAFTDDLIGVVRVDVPRPASPSPDLGQV